MQTLRTTSVALALLSLVACRSDDTGPNPGPGTNPDNPQVPTSVDCPEGQLTVCALKSENSPLHPLVDEPVDLTGLTVTSDPLVLLRDKDTDEVTLKSFYVQDPQTTQQFAGLFSGIAVVYNPAEVVLDFPGGEPREPRAGEVVSIDGTYSEFTSGEGATPQKQIRAIRVTITGQGSIQPTLVDSSAVLGNPATGLGYEGSLVRVEQVTATQATVQINGSDYFGAFRIDNSLVVSGDMYEFPGVSENQEFASITGVLRLGTAPFNAGALLLTPRFPSDVVPKDASAIVTSIVDLQNPNAPGHPLDTCRNDNGQDVVGKCAVARLNRMLVTAVDAYVSSNLRAMFVQDPSVADGRYAGIKVVYNRSEENLPEIGWYIDVEGEAIDYFGGTQLQYASWTRNGEDIGTPTPVVVNPTDLSRRSEATSVYEGVLVQLQNVTVSQDCIADSRDIDRGNWLVTGDVMIGTSFFYDYNGDIPPAEIRDNCLDAEGEPTGICGCGAEPPPRPNDQRQNGDGFQSITGLMDFSYGDWQLQPRGNEDLVQLAQ